MKKNYKTARISAIIVIALIIIASIGVNFYIKNKIEKLIKYDLPEHIAVSYEKLDVAILNGSVHLSNPKLTIKNKGDSQQHTFINLSDLKISNLSYWRYLFKNQINIGKISLENPKIVFYKDNVVKDSTDTSPTKIEKAILVDRLRIANASIRIYEHSQDSLLLSTTNLSVEIKDILLDPESISKKIPLEYKYYAATSDSIFLKAGEYENLSVKNFELKNGEATFNDIVFKTKYSKAELSKIIKIERDHYDLTMASLQVHDFDFGYIEDRYTAKSPKILFNAPNLEIYRDKLLPDDTSTKNLYNKMLRELPFDLGIDSLYIQNGNIRYEERVHPENKGGFISFNDFEAKIGNLGNTYPPSEKTELHIKANFMDQTPIDVVWNFDVQNKTDTFIFKGQVGNLNAERMNNFTEPNLKVKVEGNANRTYFTIDGNNERSRTEAKISYSDFKVTVLKKDGKEKNKFLSTVVNIFVAKDSEDPEDQFREGNAEVLRNKDKSIFNYFWISLQGALKKALTGSGKSD